MRKNSTASRRSHNQLSKRVAQSWVICSGGSAPHSNAGQQEQQPPARGYLKNFGNGVMRWVPAGAAVAT